MFLRKSIFGTASMLGLAGILSLGACSATKSSDTDPSSTDGVTGSIGLGLTLPDGSNVEQVNYVISKDGSEVRTGVIAIGADGRASTTITGLEPGTGYRVVLTAPRGDAGAPCVGEGTFTVIASATANVDVLLLCDDLGESGNVTINGSFNICPRITASSISPVTVAVGSTASIVTTWRDRDNDTLTYAWTAAAGTFSPASAASTTYTCVAPGAQVLTISATDGPSRGCTKTATLNVTCVGAGTPVDAGGPAPVVDAGGPAPVIDAGGPAPVVDAGGPAPVIDAGGPAPVVDAGGPAPVVDAGGPVGFQRSAACQQCLTTSCTLYQEELPVIAQCNTPACETVVKCVEQSKCAHDVSTVTNCYCGDVTFDTCQPSDYTPVGVCKAAIETGLMTTNKSTVLERFVNPTYPGGAAMGLVTCMADLCATQCLTN